MAVVNNESVPFYQAIHLKKRFRAGVTKTDVAGNKYLYAPGVASLVAGDFVVLDSGFNPTRLTTSSNGGMIGVAMSANTTSTSFSWFQVWGVSPAAIPANIATNASGIGLGLCASATAGRATTSAAGGKTLFGAIALSNPASNLGTAGLSDPFFQNQSTL